MSGRLQTAEFIWRGKTVRAACTFADHKPRANRNLRLTSESHAALAPERRDCSRSVGRMFAWSYVNFATESGFRNPLAFICSFISLPIGQFAFRLPWLDCQQLVSREIAIVAWLHVIPEH